MKTIILAAAGLLIAGAVMAQTDRPLGVGATSQGSFGYSLGAAVAKISTENGGPRAIVQPYGGSSTFAPMVNRGELDFGVVNALETILAKSGTETFEGKPNPELRVVAALVPSYVSILVRKDSGIKNLPDLKGKRVAWGFVSQTIVQYMIYGVLANAGLKEDDVQKVVTPNVNRQVDDLIAGRVDANFMNLGAPRVQEADAALGGVRFLSLSEAPDRAAAMMQKVPGTHVGKVQPGPGAFAVAEPTNFMAYTFLLIAGAHVPDDAVYKLVSAIHANKPALEASHPTFRAFNPDKMVEKVEGVAYHPGAIKFYREKGQWPAS
jgi:TRAP transporter TAXI family solute receptor